MVNGQYCFFSFTFKTYSCNIHPFQNYLQRGQPQLAFFKEPWRKYFYKFWKIQSGTSKSSLTVIIYCLNLVIVNVPSLTKFEAVLLDSANILICSPAVRVPVQ